ncbi:MAG: hypothetical protein HYT11_01820 [Candidatus Levybacteria bacterium]|nr:hypothetical protein [Candidatus Levybacteria bacterium]
MVGKIRAGVIEATTITVNSLNIKTEEVRIGDVTLAEYIAQNSTNSNAELSGQYIDPSSDLCKASPCMQGEALEAQIADLQSQINSLNAVLGVSTTSAEIVSLQDSIAQKELAQDSLKSSE